MKPKSTRKVKQLPEIEYYDIPLSLVFKHYIKTALVHHDWEVIAVDPSNNKVVVRRFNYDHQPERRRATG